MMTLLFYERSGETDLFFLWNSYKHLTHINPMLECTSLTWACSSWFRFLRFLMVSSFSVRIMIRSMWISFDKNLFSFLRSSHSFGKVTLSVMRDVRCIRKTSENNGLHEINPKNVDGRPFANDSSDIRTYGCAVLWNKTVLWCNCFHIHHSKYLMLLDIHSHHHLYHFRLMCLFLPPRTSTIPWQQIELPSVKKIMWNPRVASKWTS